MSSVPAPRRLAQLPGLTLTPMYTYTHKFQDQFRGDLGFNYGQLQAETDGDVHTLDLRLVYSTALPGWLTKRIN